jgi:rod shape determining protein RodA
MLKNLDFGLLILVLCLFLLGVTVISSATGVPETGLNRRVIIQVVGFILGGGFGFLILMVDYKTLTQLYKVVYVVSLLVMLTVYVPGLGVNQMGARSWIDLKIMYFQPAELAKLGFIICFAKYLENQQGRISSILDLLKIGAFISPFLLILLKQPDLGTALVFLFITCGMVYVAGADRKLIVGVIIATIIAMPISYHFMESHQRERIDAFLNPNDPTLTGNYQVMQSKITIGSGQLMGRGLFKGVYHKSDYLPIKESDFIFSVLGEETGFIGGSITIFLYFLLLTKLNNVAIKAKDQIGSLIGVGVTFMFAFQVIENIGMTIGMMPVTGVTLPFMSYGGSSIMISMMGIGLAMNVHIRRRRASYNL